MSAKKIVRRNSRQKKLLRMVEEQSVTPEVNYGGSLRNQLQMIKKDYNRLVTDVTKGYDMIRTWVEVQAASTRELLRTKFTEKLGR